jgi:methionyl-tRNA formyltransferase
MKQDSRPPGPYGRDIQAARCVLFAYHEIGYACISELLAMGAPVVALFTHEDRPGEEIWWRSCAALARANRIPVFTPEELTPEAIGHIEQLQPGVIYSFYYRNLLPDQVLKLAAKGAYNVHGSLLPQYRGRVPVNWMIINGETAGGVTLHHMVARADAGDIVGQRAVTIADDDTALSLYRKLIPEAAALIREFHPLIVTGRAPRRPQDLGAGSYYGKRRPEDGRIDWNWPARRIYNLVRALTHPYPGAFGFLAERKLLVWEAQIGKETGCYQLPGRVINFANDGVEIATGAGTIVIRRAQLEGLAEGGASVILGELESRSDARID